MINLRGVIVICGFLIGLTNSKAGDTPNQKLKKLYRNGVEIMNIMANFPVSKADAKQTLENANNQAENGDEGNTGIGRLGDDRRENDSMISDRIHQSWTKKFTNQFKFLQRKFNSWECDKFGKPDNDDVEDVWGEIIDKPGLEDYFGQFKKLIWASPPAAVRHIGETKPLTGIHLTFGRIRLWIDENIGGCYDADKVANLASSKGARGAARVETWVNKGHKKFNTMERRVCSHLYKGLVRALPSDNPYHDNPACDPKSFRKKHRDQANSQRKADREAKRAGKNKN